MSGDATGAGQPGARRSSVDSRLVRAAGTGLAALAVLAGVLGLTGVLVVRHRLLDAHTYQDALLRADVYNRVYTEVLADPQLAEAKEQLLGDLRLDGLDPQSARILATNSLRWVLPPSTIRLGTDALVDAAIGYLRGDSNTIVADVDLEKVLARLDDVTNADARAAVANAHATVVSTIGQYRAAVLDFLDGVVAGHVSPQIPVPAAAIADSQVIAVLAHLTGNRIAPTVRMSIDTAVLANDDRDALSAAMGPALDRYSASVVAAVRAELDNGRVFHVVGELAQHTNERTQAIVSDLHTVRDAISRLTVVVLVLSVVLLAVGIAALLVLHRRNARRAVLVLAVVLFFAGVATFAIWSVIRYSVAPPLHPATAIGPGTWNLPAGVRHVVRDVEQNVASSLDTAVLRVAVVPVLAAVVLAGSLLLRPALARLKWVAAVALAVVVAAAVFAFRPATHERTCNGYAELCDRRYDEIVQAATHNSMSNPDVVQFWPEQDSTIREQLDAGIRTLLIDTHYWTAIKSPDQISALVPGLPPALARLTIALDHDRLRARDGTYMCHVHCVWGGQPLHDGLEEVRSFLAANPDAVVTLIVEDEVSPTDTVSALAGAGLTRYLYEGDPGSKWPTLGDMIDHSERLVVFAENHGSHPNWYRPAFTTIQDTPFGFPSVAAMTCAPNRGPASAPLFLLNNWVSTVAPDRATAAIVNTRDFLVRRARECAEQRRRMPAFIAVDFSDIGDVLGAVNTLNNVSR